MMYHQHVGNYGNDGKEGSGGGGGGGVPVWSNLAMNGLAMPVGMPAFAPPAVMQALPQPQPPTHPHQHQQAAATAAEEEEEEEGRKAKKSGKKSAATRAQIRKVKNREFAKRSRDRKKALQETLESELRELQQENDRLRSIIRKNIPDNVSQSIIGECCYSLHSVPHSLSHLNTLLNHDDDDDDDNGNTNNKMNKKSSRDLNRSDFELIESLAATKQSFCITNPRLPDNPIVFASEAFLELTGYSREKVIGRNCRFLQGMGTNAKAVAAIREAINKGVDATTCLLNFKSDGTPFWNQFFLAALRDKHHNIVNYVGVQCPVDPPDTKPKPSPKELAIAKDANLPPQQQHTTLSHQVPPSSTLPQAVTKRIVASTASSDASAGPAAITVEPSPVSYQSNDTNQTTHQSQPQKATIDAATEALHELDNFDFDDVDWSILAEALEGKFKDGVGDLDHQEEDVNSNAMHCEEEQSSLQGDHDDDNDSHKNVKQTSINTTPSSSTSTTTKQDKANEPLSIVTKTVRSELVDALLSSHGDVKHPRFISALDVLSTIYSSSCHTANQTNSIFNSISTSSNLHASWRSLSRPSYSNCLGRDDNGDFVYELGKMSFNMFRPGNLRCSIQHTLNNIQPVCEMDGAPAAAPWSLRRELAALHNQEENDENKQPNTMLKSYDIAVALTIEPGQQPPPTTTNDQPTTQTTTPVQTCRLRALKVIHGYFLPDPDTPNRLTVWFTGGELSPAPPTPEEQQQQQEKESTKNDKKPKFGGFNEWKALFGGTYKRTWGESFSVMGARLFLGAEVKDGMDENGTMRYTLRRPVGGHGKAYVDVIYMDEDLLITKGNRGTIHVMVKNDPASSPEDKNSDATKSTLENTPSQITSNTNANDDDDDDAVVVTEDDEESSSVRSLSDNESTNAAVNTTMALTTNDATNKQELKSRKRKTPSTDNSSTSAASYMTAISEEQCNTTPVYKKRALDIPNTTPTTTTTPVAAQEKRYAYAMDNMHYSTLSSDFEQPSAAAAAVIPHVPSVPFSPLPPVLSSLPNDSHNRRGHSVSNIMRSVEAFFGVDMF